MPGAAKPYGFKFILFGTGHSIALASYWTSVNSVNRELMSQTKIQNGAVKSKPLSEFDRVLSGLLRVSKTDLLASEKRYKLERKAARKAHKS